MLLIYLVHLFKLCKQRNRKIALNVGCNQGGPADHVLLFFFTRNRCVWICVA